MTHQSPELNITPFATLKALAEAKTPEAKQALFSQIGRLAFDENSALNGAERAATSDILVGLMRFADKETRAELAKLVSSAGEIPQNLLRTLILDEFEVARALIEKGRAVSDDDLIAVLKEGSHEHRGAVAAREQLSEKVCEVIVDLDDIDLIETLAENATARVDAPTFNKMATASQTSPRLSKLLLERNDMPSIVAHRMFWWVKGPLRRQIVERHTIELKNLEATLEEAQRNGLVRAPTGGQFGPFLDFIAGQNGLSISMLIQILRQGSLDRFVMALSDRLSIDRQTAKRITADAGGESIAMACRAMQAEKGQFMSMYLMLDYLRFGKARPTGDLNHVAFTYDKVTQSRARASVVLWDSLETA